jgi:hypothetical protein
MFRPDRLPATCQVLIEFRRCLMARWMMIALFAVLIVLFVGGAAEAGVVQATPYPTCGTEIPCDTPIYNGRPDLSSGEIRGSIRGTVYEDRNGDGKCVNTGEPILAGIPINFVSNDGQWTTQLYSGENGTYGLVAAGLGTWRVSADPPAPWVVTSAKTVQAFLGENQRLVLGVDFCLSKVGTRPPVLPAAGAAISPLFAAAALVGLGLMGLGAGIEIQRRRKVL